MHFFNVPSACFLCFEASEKGFSWLAFFKILYWFRFPSRLMDKDSLTNSSSHCLGKITAQLPEKFPPKQPSPRLQQLLQQKKQRNLMNHRRLETRKPRSLPRCLACELPPSRCPRQPSPALQWVLESFKPHWSVQVT